MGFMNIPFIIFGVVCLQQYVVTQAFLPRLNTINKVKCLYMSEGTDIKDLLGANSGEPWIYSDLFTEAKLKLIESISIANDGKSALVVDNTHLGNQVNPQNLHYVKLIPGNLNQLMDTLVKHDIHIQGFPEYTNSITSLLDKVGGAFLNVCLYVTVFTLVSNFLLYLNQQRPNGGMNMLSQFDNNKFEVLSSINTNVTFADVAGCDEAKFELMEVVDFLKDKDKYIKAGAKIPRGVLLEGNPGTGKTLLAKAVAGEAGVAFISASGSEFIEMFVGVGASRVRNLFEEARKNAPCVVFIDEIDAVGRQRGAGIAGGNDEREQTLNQILTNMDGFSTADGIIVLAATNRIDILDNALTRPGRFDRKVKVPLPDIEGRKSIFNVHLKDKYLDSSVDINELSILTTGFSGADIANLANEAAIFSVRKNQTHIDQKTMLDAFEKVTVGLVSNVQVKDPNVVKLVSFHETGHALMAALFSDLFDLRKVTINENKNGMGGYTLFTPKERFLKYATKKFMLANLIVAMGGRAAEVYLYRKDRKDSKLDDLVFEHFHDLDITTGASNDLMQANKLARNYVTQYGFGDNIACYDDNNPDMPFVGRIVGSGGSRMSENSKCDIDSQVSMLVNFAYQKAFQLITENKAAFLEIVSCLQEKRVLNGEEIQYIIANNGECNIPEHTPNSSYTVLP
jgi:cell division protease FtsH